MELLSSPFPSCSCLSLLRSLHVPPPSPSGSILSLRAEVLSPLSFPLLEGGRCSMSLIRSLPLPAVPQPRSLSSALFFTPFPHPCCFSSQSLFLSGNVLSLSVSVCLSCSFLEAARFVGRVLNWEICLWVQSWHPCDLALVAHLSGPQIPPL